MPSAYTVPTKASVFAQMMDDGSDRDEAPRPMSAVPAAAVAAPTFVPAQRRPRAEGPRTGDSARRTGPANNSNSGPNNTGSGSGSGAGRPRPRREGDGEGRVGGAGAPGSGAGSNSVSGVSGRGPRRPLDRTGGASSPEGREGMEPRRERAPRERERGPRHARPEGNIMERRDRHSASGYGREATEKRDGTGAYNWGRSAGVRVTGDSAATATEKIEKTTDEAASEGEASGDAAAATGEEGANAAVRGSPDARDAKNVDENQGPVITSLGKFKAEMKKKLELASNEEGAAVDGEEERQKQAESMRAQYLGEGYTLYKSDRVVDDDAAQKSHANTAANNSNNTANADHKDKGKKMHLAELGRMRYAGDDRRDDRRGDRDRDDRRMGDRDIRRGVDRTTERVDRGDDRAPRAERGERDERRPPRDGAREGHVRQPSDQAKERRAPRQEKPINLQDQQAFPMLPTSAH